MSVSEYLKQPTTILGIAGFVGAVSTAVAHYLTGDVNASALFGIVIASAVHVAMPDNSGAPSSVEKLVTDAVTAAAQKRLADAMPLLVSDGMNALAAFHAPRGLSDMAQTGPYSRAAGGAPTRLGDMINRQAAFAAQAAAANTVTTQGTTP